MQENLWYLQLFAWCIITHSSDIEAFLIYDFKYTSKTMKTFFKINSWIYTCKEKNLKTSPCHSDLFINMYDYIPIDYLQISGISYGGEIRLFTLTIWLFKISCHYM